jgi:hypothetical protein
LQYCFAKRRPAIANIETATIARREDLNVFFRFIIIRLILGISDVNPDSRIPCLESKLFFVKIAIFLAALWTAHTRQNILLLYQQIRNPLLQVARLL